MAKKVAARTFDFSNVKEGSGISKKHKPDGEYLGKVTEVRDDPAKDGEAMWLFIIQLDVDKTATYPFYCKLVENQLWKLRNIFLAAGVSIPKKAVKINPNDVVGKELGVILESTEYDGREQSEISGLIPKSELSDYAVDDEDEDDDEEEEEAPAPKRGRGRPRKAAPVEEEDDEDEEDEEPAPVKRGRGRPRKVVEPEPEDDDEDEDEEEEEPAPKKKRGRPAKAAPAKKKRRVVEDDDDDDLDIDL